MHFSHSPEIRAQHPGLACAVLAVQGLHARADVSAAVARFNALAARKLAAVPSEGELAEIQAWRRAFSRMGLKPTQYRCAAESLLRRFRKEGALPAIHPLIDLCNAASLAFAIPVAVFDLAHVQGGLRVRPATGQERYQAFSGETEQPEPGEVVFADDADNAHARRWTHRQSGLSAIREGTGDVLVVAEALHEGAQADVRQLAAALGEAISQAWGVQVRTAFPSAEAPRHEF